MNISCRFRDLSYKRATLAIKRKVSLAGTTGFDRSFHGKQMEEAGLGCLTQYDNTGDDFLECTATGYEMCVSQNKSQLKGKSMECHYTNSLSKPKPQDKKIVGNNFLKPKGFNPHRF